MSDMWMNHLDREMKLKSAIILSGNIDDIVANPQKGNQYTSMFECVKDLAFKNGYKKVISWNRAEGGQTWTSGVEVPEKSLPKISGETNNDENNYSEHFKDVVDNVQRYLSPENFFPYLREYIEEEKEATAVIINYSDFIFDGGQSLSQDERKNITNLMLSIEKSKEYNENYVTVTKTSVGHVLILMMRNTASIPPVIYVDNPVVATINIPLPGRDEREKLIERDQNLLHIKQNIGEHRIKEDFIDALDGFSLKDIEQIIKLSNDTMLIPEPLNFEKLINLYRYGEKISPWEELDYEKLKTIEDTLKKRVKGQDEAVKKVRDVIIRAYTGFAGMQHSVKQKKPKGVLFFVGPTGVGKTELAKALAEFVFGDESAYRRFDMSEYTHEESDQRLIGAPPGYVGYEKGGELTNAVKEKPFCVLLFDEVEKAHGRIMDKFLQILEDGRLTDGKGETVYFSETFIIFTSNIGASDANINLNDADVRNYFIDHVKEYFNDKLKRPEILNRIGSANIVPFNFIKDDQVLINIAKSKFEPIREFVKERYKAEIKFEDEDEAFRVFGKSVDKKNGGRGMLNAMEEYLLNPLSEYIFSNMARLEKGGRTITIKIDKKPDGSFDGFDIDS